MKEGTTHKQNKTKQQLTFFQNSAIRQPNTTAKLVHTIALGQSTHSARSGRQNMHVTDTNTVSDS
jgi:hypothetical protein